MRYSRVLLIALLAVATAACAQTKADEVLGVRLREPLSQFVVCEKEKEVPFTLITKAPCYEPGNEPSEWVVRNLFDYNYPLWVHTRDGVIVEVETNFEPGDASRFVEALRSKYGRPASVSAARVGNLMGATAPNTTFRWRTPKVRANLYTRGRSMDLGYFEVMTAEEAIALAHEASSQQHALNGQF